MMNESFQLIYDDLQLEVANDATEQEVLDVIAIRVEFFLENDKDLLLSYLYRLDIDERKITDTLHPNALVPAHIGIAKLIMNRQKQRVETKQKYQVDPIEGWEF